MVDTKPATSKGGVSLVCSSLGCLCAVALPAVYSHGLSQETTGVSAGLAVLYAGCLSGTLCLLGVIFGIIALRRIRRGECGSRGKAWAGIILGCVPFAVLLAYFVPAWWEELWIRIGNPVPRAVPH